MGGSDQIWKIPDFFFFWTLPLVNIIPILLLLFFPHHDLEELFWALIGHTSQYFQSQSRDTCLTSNIVHLCIFIDFDDSKIYIPIQSYNSQLKEFNFDTSVFLHPTIIKLSTPILKINLIILLESFHKSICIWFIFNLKGIIAIVISGFSCHGRCGCGGVDQVKQALMWMVVSRELNFLIILVIFF